MNTLNNRTQLLQQIPVFALRKLVAARLDDPSAGPAIRARFGTVLHRKPRDFQRALQRLTREQLTRLIIESSEVDDNEILEQFEEHRYGISPSFNIYVLNPARLDHAALTSFREKFEQALAEFNVGRADGHPSVRRVALNDLGPLRDRLEVIEATYRFQSRLDYIDENEQAVSPYETLYGFFWLNTVDGYVILQARQPDVLKAVRDGIGKAAGIDLTALVITKRFNQDSLGFLDAQQMRSVRLHDPIPDSPSFRWLSISDDHLYEKDYQSWEARYPEVRSARYRTVIAEVKETMLTIRCDQGALSLAGAIPASLFRSWCLNTLGEIIRIHNAFALEAVAFVPTLDLTSKAELLRFTAPQKERFLDLITALLTVKGAGGADQWPLKGSPLELAATLGKYVRVQAPYQCAEPGCDPDEEQLVECPNCGRKFFQLQYNDGWELVCQAERSRCWTGRLPLKFECSHGHPIEISAEDLEDSINIIPVRDLLQTTADVVNGYLKGHSFDPAKETFYLRSCNLWYFPDRGKALAQILIIQNIGTVAPGGSVTGAVMGASEPV